jgi:hypothetical protein
MILSDIEGGLYVTVCTCKFLKDTIEVTEIRSDNGRGIDIKYVNLDLIIRLYKFKLDKALPMYTDKEMKVICENCLKEYLGKLYLDEIEEWIHKIKYIVKQDTERQVKDNIRKALGV